MLNTASVKEMYFFFCIRTGIRIMVDFIRNKRVHEIIHNIFKVLTEKKKSVNQNSVYGKNNLQEKVKLVYYKINES